MDQIGERRDKRQVQEHVLVPRENETLLESDTVLSTKTSTGAYSRRGPWKEKWRRMLLMWTVVAWIVLVTHICAAALLPKGDFGLGILAESKDCASFKRKHTAWSLFLNTLATLVFVASNYGLQCLSSPTREDLDAAHAEGHAMEVGLPSVKNLLRIGWTRRVIWLLLATSGLPMHAL
jgi:hypothetical protein